MLNVLEVSLFKNKRNNVNKKWNTIERDGGGDYGGDGGIGDGGDCGKVVM